MDTRRFASFFQTPLEATESRMRALSSSAAVRKARAGAEVEFRSREVAANWRNWIDKLGDIPSFRAANVIPPHWEAGVRYAAKVIPAFGRAAMIEIALPDEFEGFLRECACVVSDRTYKRKLRPYDSLPAGAIDVVVENFHQLVRAAVEIEVARLSLEAWQRHQRDLDAETPSTPPPKGAAPAGSGHDARGVTVGVQGRNADELAPDREARLKSFLDANDASIAAVCEAASVHKPDMQRWRRGTLNGESVMSQRIECVLSGETRLKADIAMAAESSGG